MKESSPLIMTMVDWQEEMVRISSVVIAHQLLELMDEMRASGFKPTPLLITKEREARNRSDKFDGFDE